MGNIETMKKLCKLELAASQQEIVVEDAKNNLKDQKDKYDGIIAEMRSVIRDERTGQEHIDFPDGEKKAGEKIEGSSSKSLRLPPKKKNK